MLAGLKGDVNRCHALDWVLFLAALQVLYGRVASIITARCRLRHANCCSMKLRLLIVISCLPLVSLAASAPEDRYHNYSLQPFVDLQPGFTTNPRQELLLDLVGVGREPVRLRSVAINGRTLSPDAWKVRLNQVVIVPEQDLRAGLNRITVQYLHRADSINRGGEQALVHEFFLNHQPEEHVVAFGERGELVVNGRRRFVRGGYRSGQGDQFTDALQSAVTANFNVVHDYRFENFDVERLGLDRLLREARAYLRRARELELGVFFGLPRTAVREYNEEQLAMVIAGLSGEPALWLWYIYDEPNETTLSVESASKVYSLLRRLDPTRPSVMLVNRPSTMFQYYPFCDSLWYNRYPIIATSSDLISLSPIVAAVQLAKQVVPSKKPVWPVLQAHDNKGIPSVRKRVPFLAKPTDENHRPNEAELRAQAHLSISLGAMSVIYYWGPERWYSMTRDTPGLWRSLSKVLAEIKGLEEVLLSGEDVPLPEVVGGHNKVTGWAKQHDDTMYVGLVNASVHTPAIMSLRVPPDYMAPRKLYGDGVVDVQREKVGIRLSGAGVTVIAFPRVGASVE